MTKLTYTQLIILAAAARRDDCMILPLPKKLKLGTDATEDALKGLIKKKLAAEEPATDGAPRWREAADGQAMTLKITPSGLKAIGALESKEGEAKASGSPPAGKTKGRKSPAGTNQAPRKGQLRQRSASPAGRSGSSREIRGGSKLAKVIDLLRRSQGASLSEMQKATGWQAHSVRGVMSGAIKKKLGLGITSSKDDSGERRYRVAE
jgi:hypothetical protein